MDATDVCVDDEKCLDEAVVMRLSSDPENLGTPFIDRQSRAPNSWLSTTGVLQKHESKLFCLRGSSRIPATDDLQVATFRARDHPLCCPLVSSMLAFLSRCSGAIGRARSGDCPHDDLAVGSALRTGARGSNSTQADDFALKTGVFVRPQIFQKVWRPHYDRILGPVRQAGIPIMFHSDGKIDDAIPMLVEMGVSAIHPMDPSGIDYQDYKKRYGDRLTLFGNIDITWPLVEGTPADVQRDVREHMEGS